MKKPQSPLLQKADILHSVTLPSLILLFICLTPQLQAQEIILTLGQTKAIKFAGNKVWIQDRKIVSAQASGHSLVLQGLTEGETLLRLDSSVRRVQVLHPLQIELFEQFQRYVSRLPGLKLKMRNGHVIVEGTLYRYKDWKALAGLVRKSPKSYRFEARMSEDIQSQVDRAMNQMFEKNGLRPQKFVFADAVELRLPNKHPDLERIRTLLMPFGILVSTDSTQIQSEPTIKTRITVAEIQRGQMMSWGLAWPGAMTAQVFPKLSASADPLEAQLNALETRGHGRVLASPNLICQSGQEAEFLAGGEFPIKFVNYKQKEVIWKKYGILLKVKPRADSSGRMNLKIETEVSSITEIVDGIPSLATNRVSSTFDLKETKTIVLSGLLKEQTTTGQSGLPWLQRIPILGSLFSSKDYIEKRTELLIFVRPEILQETPPEDARLDNGHLVESEGLWNSSN
jgi:pilus assembly protein CpaC